MTQEPDEEAKVQQREVQRMLGRCLLRLQQYERLIKAIMAANVVSAPLRELEAARAKRAKSVARKTLGTLVGELVGSFLVAGEPEMMQDAPDHCASVSVRFALGLSDEDYAQTEAELGELVLLRNTLVHHFIDQHDLWSLDGCRHAQESLNADYRRIDQHYQRLQSWAEDLGRMQRYLAEHVRSDEFRDQLFGDAVPTGPGG